MRICVNDIGPALPQVPREDNKTITLQLFSRWEIPINDAPSSMTDTELTQADILYMDTKALYVQILRSAPSLIGRDRKELNLAKIADSAAQNPDPSIVKKGIKVKDMLTRLQEMAQVDSNELSKILSEEIAQELEHLGDLKEKVNQEIASLQVVYTAICDHNNFLTSQLDTYKAYLQNVRIQSGKKKTDTSKINQVNSGTGSDSRRDPGHLKGPIKITHNQLEKEGIVVESNVPENRRSTFYFMIVSPVPGTFVISLHVKGILCIGWPKGRENPIIEMDLKLDDLLEKQQMGVQFLDLEWVQLCVTKLLALLNKTFLKR